MISFSDISKQIHKHDKVKRSAFTIHLKSKYSDPSMVDLESEADLFNLKYCDVCKQYHHESDISNPDSDGEVIDGEFVMYVCNDCVDRLEEKEHEKESTQ